MTDLKNMSVDDLRRTVGYAAMEAYKDRDYEIAMQAFDELARRLREQEKGTDAWCAAHKVEQEAREQAEAELEQMTAKCACWSRREATR